MLSGWLEDLETQIDWGKPSGREGLRLVRLELEQVKEHRELGVV